MNRVQVAVRRALAAPDGRVLDPLGDEHLVDSVNDAVRGEHVRLRHGGAADDHLATLEADLQRLAFERLRRAELRRLAAVTSPLTTW